MIRYTTPSIPLTVDTVIPNDAEIYVTFSQGSTAVTKTDVEVERGEETTSLLVTLTQEETADFKPFLPVMIQCNWILEDGTRTATDTASISTFDNLLSEVIEHGN